MHSKAELSAAIREIVAHHRMRRFAMKSVIQSDNALGAFVRRNYTDWRFDMPEKERAKQVKRAQYMIEAARDGTCDNLEVQHLVLDSDSGTQPMRKLRADREAFMVAAAEKLPAYQWMQTVRGFGALGFATLVAEATGAETNYGFSDYATHDKVWKRFGFAPYQGLAMSSWKRDSWRPRALTSTEWVDNPFSAVRYAMVFAIVESLLKQQLRGKGSKLIRLGDGSEKYLSAANEKALPEGAALVRVLEMTEPNGRYGEVFLRRRAHTAQTHPEWTPQHSKMDAMRVTAKALLRDLWRTWRRDVAHLFVEETGLPDLALQRAVVSVPVSSTPEYVTASCASPARQGPTAECLS